MDGKIMDMSMPNDLKAITRSGLSQQLKTRSSMSLHLRTECDNENELTFEDMYGAQNLNSQFISNVSRLHLATQLAVLRKANLLDKEPKIDSASTMYRAVTTSMAKELALTESSASAEVTETEKIEDDTYSIFTGEWTRPKKYLCSTCFARFSNYWDMEDHRWIKHPNVWGFNYEFPADQAPGLDWAMQRCLNSQGVLSATPESSAVNMSPARKCTKCQKVVTPTAEFHKHILECGGDTTWMSTMFASSTMKKHKKWKPYGSRRRRNIGRVRGLKRNIPTTPVKIIGLPKNRQRAGDTETIQRMIANLPPKRISRRIIQFDDIESKNQNRNNNESNILTRKRKERLDAKTSAQIARTFATDNYVLIKMPDARKKKQRDEAKISIKKSVKFSKVELPTTDVTEPSRMQGQTSDTSPLNSDVDVPIKEEASSPPVCNIPKDSSIIDFSKDLNIALSSADTINDPVHTAEFMKQEDEEHSELDLDLENIEPADSDLLIPDSSIILAAMRETMRQTDAVIPSQTYTVTSKKRKRDDTKCKLESESSTEPESKRVVTVDRVIVTCTECKDTFTSSGRKDARVCEECCSKRGKTRSASLRDSRRCKRSDTPDSKPNSSVESTVEPCQSENFKSTTRARSRKSLTQEEKKDSSKDSKSNEKTSNVRSKHSVSDVEKEDEAGKTVPLKSGKNLKNEETGINVKSLKMDESCENDFGHSLKVAESMAKSLIDEADKKAEMLTTKEDANTSEAVENPVLLDSDEVPKNSSITTEPKQNAKDLKSVESNKNLTELKSAPQLKPNITFCEVCNIPSIRSICKHCELIARKNKICAFCKQENTAKSNALPLCDVCKDRQNAAETNLSTECGVLSKREVIEWTLCKVCRRTNHKVVCSSCVVMSQKHKICARCNVRWEDPQKSGMPVCPPCEKEWYPRASEDDDDVDKCTECSTLQTTEVTLRKLCDKCNNTGMTKKLCESASRCNLNEVSIQATNAENTNAAVIAVDTSAVPTIVAGASTTTSAIDSPPIQIIPVDNCAIPVVSSTSALPVSTSIATTSVPAFITSTSAQPITAVNTCTMPIVTPSTLAVSKSSIEEAQANVSPSKKNVILICKGCYGLYDKVSAYKQHCDTCLARVSCMEEKKPLLGFVKRNATVASNDVNNGGASFEILEGVQIKSYPMNESGKIEPDTGSTDNDTAVTVSGSFYDSDSSTSSKRTELSKNPKTKRSLASNDSITETIESVIKAVCYHSVPSEESPSSSTSSKSSSRRPSSSVTEIPIPDLENFKKVKKQLESSLETLKSDDEMMNTEISFLNEEQTPPVVAPNTPKRRKLMVKKGKVSVGGRTTRSSLMNKVDVEVFQTLDENLKSNVKTTRKQKTGNDISSVVDEETVSESADMKTKATRLRRKTTAEMTNRTLRSRSKPEVRDADESEKPEENVIEPAPCTSAKTRKSKELKKKLDVVNQNTNGNEEDSVPNEEDGDGRTHMKPKSEFSDLGFVVVKTNKPVRKGAKRDSCETLDLPSKNELDESDRKVRKLTYESDPMCSQNVPKSSSKETAVEYPMPMPSESQCNFLGVAAPSSSVAAAYDESIALNGFSQDESLHMDGFEASGAPYFDLGQPDGAQSTPWYSAINFLDQSSLGSILDSVNELLARPEVASSCVGDTINSQSVQKTQNNEFVLQSCNDQATTGNESVQNVEEESPTLIDLDHQMAHQLEMEVKEEEKPGSNEDLLAQHDAPNSAGSTEVICDVCEQPYLDSKTLKMHMLAVHQANIPTTRSAANGKLRSSTRINQNDVQAKQKCTHCQKVLVSKADLTLHLQEHLKTFDKHYADFLKKCIAEKLEDIFLNKALDNYMKSPQESSSVRNNPPLKILSQLNAAKKDQFGSWKSAIAQMLNLDSNKTGKISSAPTTATKSVKQSSKKTSTNTTKPLKSQSEATSPDAAEKGYPCPMCPKSFQFTTLRNQHLIMVHAPRESTHPSQRRENLTNTLNKNDKGSPLETSSQSDGKVIRSYLLTESVDSCLEAKREAVNKAIAESSGRNMNEECKQIGYLASATSMRSLSDEPPALEPAASGEHIPNNTDRSPPKLEALARLPVPPAPAPPSILRQNLTSSSTGNVNPPSTRNGKPCRQKMSKKELGIPPAVVKFKAEQALLELSINKFRKIR